MATWKDKAVLVRSAPGATSTEGVAANVGSAVRASGREPEATFDNMLANFFQGATFGFGDEIVAGGRDLFGIEDYDSALEGHRNLVKQGQAASPVGAFAANLAGGVLVPGIGFAKAAAAPTLAGKAIGLAGAGAATGGLSGFGVGEGGLSERLATAAEGAAIGGVATPVLMGLGSLAAKGGQTLRNVLGFHSGASVENAAGRKILQALERGGMTADDAAKALDDLRAIGVTGATLADLGENTRQLAGAAARIPGKGAELAASFADGRQAGQGVRLVAAFEDALGTTKGLAPFLDDVSSRQFAASRPLYARADAVEVPTAPLKAFLDEPYFQRALKQGLKIASLQEGADAVPKLNVDDLFNSLPPTMPTRWLDLAKRGLDADILASRVSDPTLSRALSTFKRRFLSVLDDLNADYKAARAAWAGEAELIDAAEIGRKALTLSPAELADQVSALNGSTRQAFRIGLLDYVKDAIEKAPDAADKVKRVFGNDRVRELLATVLSPREFAALDAVLGAESQMFKTLVELRGNSRTAVRGQADADFQVQPSVTIPTSWRGLAGNVLRMAEGYTKGFNERIAEKVLQGMTARDAAGVDGVIDALRALSAKDLARLSNPLRTATPYGVGLGAVAVPGLLNQ
jgi:hypothetical protein